MRSNDVRSQGQMVYQSKIWASKSLLRFISSVSVMVGVALPGIAPFNSATLRGRARGRGLAARVSSFTFATSADKAASTSTSVPSDVPVPVLRPATVSSDPDRGTGGRRMLEKDWRGVVMRRDTNEIGLSPSVSVPDVSDASAPAACSARGAFLGEPLLGECSEALECAPAKVSLIQSPMSLMTSLASGMMVGICR
jgi:hypothetical protein